MLSVELNVEFFALRVKEILINMSLRQQENQKCRFIQWFLNFNMMCGVGSIWWNNLDISGDLLKNWNYSQKMVFSPYKDCFFCVNCIKIGIKILFILRIKLFLDGCNLTETVV